MLSLTAGPDKMFLVLNYFQTMVVYYSLDRQNNFFDLYNFLVLHLNVHLCMFSRDEQYWLNQFDVIQVTVNLVLKYFW